MEPSFSSLRGDADLAVYIDLKSPYAFIAVEPTRAMAASLGVRIDCAQDEAVAQVFGHAAGFEVTQRFGPMRGNLAR